MAGSNAKRRASEAAPLLEVPRPGDPERVRRTLRLAADFLRQRDIVRATDTYLQVASMYADAGQSIEALAVGFRALQLHGEAFRGPRVRDLLQTLGEVAAPLCRRAIEEHRQGGRRRDAIALLEAFTELFPADSELREELATELLAIDACEQARHHLWEVARIYEDDGNNRDLVRVLQQILDLRRDDAGALRSLARAYIKIGEPRRALALLSALLQLRPSDPAGHELMARALLQLGQIGSSLEIVKRMLIMMHRRRLFDESRALLQRARRWQPEHPRFSSGLEALAARRLSPPAV